MMLAGGGREAETKPLRSCVHLDWDEPLTAIEIRWCGAGDMNPCITEVAAALSSTTRLAILRASRSNKNFTEIATEIGIAASTLTHHVAVLRGAGLVRIEQTGARKYLVVDTARSPSRFPGRS